MSFLAYIVSLYSLVLLVRFLSSFFMTSHFMRSPFFQILYMLTEPYLMIFRFRFLRIGIVDFSPILAIAFLSLLESILLGKITSFSELLLFILISFWSTIKFFLVIIVLIIIFRLISYYAFRQTYPSLNYSYLDSFLSRFSFGLCRLFIRRGYLNYSQSLIISGFILICLGFIGDVLITKYIVFLLRQIPF